MKISVQGNSSQVHNLTKTPETARKSNTSLEVSLKENPSQQTNIPKLVGLLSQMNILKTASSLLNALPIKAQQELKFLLLQLTMPTDPKKLQQWLQQRPGDKVLAQVLLEFKHSEPQQFKALLLSLQPETKTDLQALLRLHAEQRYAETKQSLEQPILISLPQPDQKPPIELTLKRHLNKNSEKKSEANWQICLHLPIENHGFLRATANYKNKQVGLLFETDTEYIQKMTENNLPLLLKRIEAQGIRCNEYNVTIAQHLTSLTESIPTGLHIEV